MSPRTPALFGERGTDLTVPRDIVVDALDQMAAEQAGRDSH